MRKSRKDYWGEKLNYHLKLANYYDSKGLHEKVRYHKKKAQYAEMRLNYKPTDEKKKSTKTYGREIEL